MPDHLAEAREHLDAAESRASFETAALCIMQAKTHALIDIGETLRGFRDDFRTTHDLLDILSTRLAAALLPDGTAAREARAEAEATVARVTMRADLADHFTKAAYKDLRAAHERYEAAKGRENAALNACHREARRADDAEAVIGRVQALADEWAGSRQEASPVFARHLRAALTLPEAERG